MAAAAILKNHENRDISVMVWPIFTKFGTLVQNGSLNHSDNTNNNNNDRLTAFDPGQPG